MDDEHVLLSEFLERSPTLRAPGLCRPKSLMFSSVNGGPLSLSFRLLLLDDVLVFLEAVEPPEATERCDRCVPALNGAVKGVSISFSTSPVAKDFLRRTLEDLDVLLDAAVAVTPFCRGGPVEDGSFFRMASSNAAMTNPTRSDGS